MAPAARLKASGTRVVGSGRTISEPDVSGYPLPKSAAIPPGIGRRSRAGELLQPATDPEQLHQVRADPLDLTAVKLAQAAPIGSQRGDLQQALQPSRALADQLVQVDVEGQQGKGRADAAVSSSLGKPAGELLELKRQLADGVDRSIPYPFSGAGIVENSQRSLDQAGFGPIEEDRSSLWSFNRAHSYPRIS